VEALVGDIGGDPIDPLANPVTGPRGRLPVNLSGGLKARGHPVGGTGLFQICENYLQITDRFPHREAQVPNARFGISNSIGGPGNNNYVTLLERADGRRRRDEVAQPRRLYESSHSRLEREQALDLSGGDGHVLAATTIHVTAGGSEPIHVALLEIAGRRVFAKLDRAPDEAAPARRVLAGQKVKFLVKDDGDHYFSIPERGFDLGRVVSAIRKRVGA
jgi:hypothetical protein